MNSTAPGLQTGPTWRLIWQLSQTQLREKFLKTFRFEIRHTVSESVFILTRQRLVFILFRECLLDAPEITSRQLDATPRLSNALHGFLHRQREV